MARIQWTQAEQQAVIDEGLRLRRAGNVPTTIVAMMEKAQRVLPKARRRPIASTGKAQWFFDALDSTPAQAQDGPASDERQRIAITTPGAAESAPAADPGTQVGKPKVFWRDAEKRALSTEAARLLVDLQVGSAHDALMRAQSNVLPPERRRPIHTMTSVADWYPAQLQAAASTLRRGREEAKAAAEAQAEQAPAAPATPEPTLTATTAAVATTVVEPAASPTLASVLGRPWAALREHLVLEVAGIVAEGILRGLESVRLSAPQQQPSSDQPEPRAHVPFVVEPPKERPPSVLVVGLRGAQVPQIEADFRGRLDLRFCGADDSKDRLRSMTERADTTVAFVDFLSHSHTDIIKARARHYIESAGGMTSLRKTLADLAGLHTNGTAATAHV